MSTTGTLKRLASDLDELVARHDRGKDLAEFARWKDDPIGFIRDVLGDAVPGPWERQVEIAEAVRDNPLVAVQSANGIGKDWLAARLAMWAAYCHGALAIISGPTERQVREVCMGEVARAFHKATDLPGELYANSLRLPGGEAGILAFTSSEASRLTGFHAPRIFAVVSEAQGVEDFAWEGVFACAVGENDRILVLGNPTSPVGRFFDVCRSDSWRTFAISAYDHPNLREGRTVIPGGPSQAFVDRIASEFGRESPQFRSRVLGQFPEDAAEALVRRAWLDDAVARWRARDASGWRGPGVLSVDVARQGPDHSVCAVHQAAAVRQLERWHGADGNEGADHVERVATAADLGRPPVVIDATGLGWALFDALRARGWPVVAFVAARGARDTERFANARAEAAWACRVALETGTLPLPPDEELHEELLAIEWGLDPQGRILIQGKDEIKAKLKRSPDRADAVCILAWYLDRDSHQGVVIGPGAAESIGEGLDDLARTPAWSAGAGGMLVTPSGAADAEDDLPSLRRAPSKRDDPARLTSGTLTIGYNPDGMP